MPDPYRAATTPPLVWTVKDAVLAVDPATGELRWRHDVDGVVRKLLPIGDHVALVLSEALEILYVATGEVSCAMDFPFRITTAIAAAGGIVAAGPEGALSVSLDGDVRWSIVQRRVAGKHTLVMEDGFGAEQWTEAVTGSRFQHVPGLVHDGQVAQPDLED